MILSRWKSGLGTVLCLAAFSQASLAQVPMPTILEVQAENVVQYVSDVADPARLATSPTVTPAASRTFGTAVLMGDIVSVNGRPAKGTAIINQRTLNLRTSPIAGQADSDVVRNSSSDYALEILQPDGTPIGSVFANGFSGGPAPPGALLAVTGSNNAIVGGTGAFLGARGQLGAGVTTVPIRLASVSEDPLNRRPNGGGKFGILVQLIPLFRPEIVPGVTGPAVFHADFAPVTAANPARPGETLILRATGLGPTSPGIDPGRPFPQTPFAEVNSPLDVTINGQAAQVLNKVGWPGTTDNYRVDIRVPAGTAPGTATIQLAAAFIAGPEAKISIQ